MSVWIKICGLTTAEGVEAAAHAGVDAIGFVFATSVRQVTPERARELAQSAPRHILRVAVMLHPTQAWLDQVLEAFKPDVLQCDAEDFGALVLPQSLGRLPVHRADLEPWIEMPARLLFEGARSGSGETADWGVARRLAQRTQLVLAGGLGVGNVGSALAAVHPFGVDVSSGVERAPGIKSRALIMDFVAAVRSSQPARVAGVDR